jgi:hypothetical protein
VYMLGSGCMFLIDLRGNCMDAIRSWYTINEDKERALDQPGAEVIVKGQEKNES